MAVTEIEGDGEKTQLCFVKTLFCVKAQAINGNTTVNDAFLFNPHLGI